MDGCSPRTTAPPLAGDQRRRWEEKPVLGRRKGGRGEAGSSLAGCRQLAVAYGGRGRREEREE
uniref:DUF834 domain-containing protein n=1 Tax=Oryza brachyantha TaxID=4533 RepID=J3LL59_ORYBR